MDVHSTRLQLSIPLIDANARIFRILLHFMVGIGAIGAAFFLHEINHALMALAFGQRIILFNVLGIQWYPFLAWRAEAGLGGFVGWVGKPDPFQQRVILLAGSQGTLLIALFSAAFLNLFRTNGLKRTALVVSSFYFLDSVIHLWPVLGFSFPAMRPSFLRTFSEAYYAAVDLGIPSSLYIALILVSTALIPLLLIRALRPPETHYASNLDAHQPERI